MINGLVNLVRTAKFNVRPSSNVLYFKHGFLSIQYTKPTNLNPHHWPTVFKAKFGSPTIPLIWHIQDSHGHTCSVGTPSWYEGKSKFLAVNDTMFDCHNWLMIRNSNMFKYTWQCTCMYIAMFILKTQYHWYYFKGTRKCRISKNRDWNITEYSTLFPYFIKAVNNLYSYTYIQLYKISL